MTDAQQEPPMPPTERSMTQEEAARPTPNAGTSQLDLIRAAATRYPRCCDLWQDSLGGMYCTECAQKTFAMLREIQELFGVGKDCQLVGEPGCFTVTVRYNDNGEFGAVTGWMYLAGNVWRPIDRLRQSDPTDSPNG